MLKGIPSSRSRVDSKYIEELWQEKVIRLEVWKSCCVNGTVIDNLADRTAQKQQQT